MSELSVQHGGEALHRRPLNLGEARQARVSTERRSMVERAAAERSEGQWWKGGGAEGSEEARTGASTGTKKRNKKATIVPLRAGPATSETLSTAEVRFTKA